MNKLEQAARQALDALENAYENGFLTGITGLKTIDTLTALREALDHSGEANEMVAEQVKQEDKDLVAQMNIDVGLKQKVYEALAEQAEQEPVACDWEKPCDKLKATQESLREHMEEIHNLRKQVAALKAVLDAWNNVEQKPVAWLRPACVDNFATHNYKTCERTDYGAFPTYAAPVRTKDLTDEDLCEIEQKCGYISHDNIRKIIALYEEKKNG